jgi:hypothetical protein
MRNFAIAALLLTAAATAYPQDNRTIEGKLEIANDMFVVVTEEPINATTFDETVSSNRIMLAGQSAEQAQKIKRLVGKCVRATGIVGPAHTRYHTEPLIIVINSVPRVIEAGGASESSTGATTPPPGSALRGQVQCILMMPN